MPKPRSRSGKLSKKDREELLKGASMRTELSDEEPIYLCIYDRVYSRYHLNHMLLSQGMSSDLSVPNLGYIAYLGITPIAAGFLIDMGNHNAMLDSLITNASCSQYDRNRALNHLVQKLIEVAQLHKFKQIIAFTKDKNTLLRAQAHSFEVLPHTVIALNLSGD